MAERAKIYKVSNNSCVARCVIRLRSARWHRCARLEQPAGSRWIADSAPVEAYCRALCPCWRGEDARTCEHREAGAVAAVK